MIHRSCTDYRFQNQVSEKFRNLTFLSENLHGFLSEMITNSDAEKIRYIENFSVTYSPLNKQKYKELLTTFL